MKLIDKSLVAKKMPARLAKNTFFKGLFLLATSSCTFSSRYFNLSDIYSRNWIFRLAIFTKFRLKKTRRSWY